MSGALTTERGKKIDTVWSGTWVADRLGVRLQEGGDPAAPRLDALLGLALRRNPKRAHLLVSRVLGKHVPQSPEAVYGAGYGLGERVRALLGDGAAAAAVVLGYAETATGLGHCVADGLALAPYLHSTRRPVPGVEPAAWVRGGPLARHLAPAAARGPGAAHAAAGRWCWSTTSSPPATPC